MKKRRKRLGLSQAKLAEKVNTAPTYIAMIELEKKFPSVEMIERIADALEMDTTELFSVIPLPENAVKNLQKEVLLDFKEIISKKLREL
jgi:transcriptional regulator with XRE-family HTH domain